VLGPVSVAMQAQVYVYIHAGIAGCWLAESLCLSQSAVRVAWCHHCSCPAGSSCSTASRPSQHGQPGMAIFQL